MKDVEIFFNTLAEDLYGGKAVNSEENYHKTPNYKIYYEIFASSTPLSNASLDHDHEGISDPLLICKKAEEKPSQNKVDPKRKSSRNDASAKKSGKSDLPTVNSASIPCNDCEKKPRVDSSPFMAIASVNSDVEAPFQL